MLVAVLAALGLFPGQEMPLSAAELEGKLRTHLQRDLKMQNLPANLKVEDRTTDAIWKQLKVQVVRVALDPNSPTGSTFVLCKGSWHKIGMEFGGDGVTSVAVADLRGDKKPLLVYSFAWGSGLHRSQVGVFDPWADKPVAVVSQQAIVNDVQHDWQVEATDKGVRVVGGGVNFGELQVETRDGQLAVSIRLRDDLPNNVRANIREFKK